MHLLAFGGHKPPAATADASRGRNARWLLGVSMADTSYAEAMQIGPLDFFDTLLAVDWDRRFEPFDEEQLWQLRRYNVLAHELGTSSFFARPLRFSFKASADESYQRLDHAGYDSLRSMTMSFRQLWDKKEPTRFEAIRHVLRSHTLTAPGGVGTVVLLDVLGARFKEATRAVMMKDVWADDPLGKPKEVTRARQVIEDWLYSGPFHAGRDRIERVERWSPTAYEFTLTKAIHAVVGVMWELQIIVMGALGEVVTAAA